MEPQLFKRLNVTFACDFRRDPSPVVRLCYPPSTVANPPLRWVLRREGLTYSVSFGKSRLFGGVVDAEIGVAEPAADFGDVYLCVGAFAEGAQLYAAPEPEWPTVHLQM